MEKRIAIDQLQPGMYLVGMDKSWWQTPFIFHRRLVKRAEEITLLKQLGVREVAIDPARGKDVAPSSLSPGEDEIIQSCLQARPDVPRGEAALRALRTELPTARSVREKCLSTVQQVFEGVQTGARIDSQAVKEAVAGLVASILRCHEASLLLLQISHFDADLFTHSADVCTISLVVGKSQGVPQEQLAILGIGALLHDVGQMRLPHNLITKPELHTDRERRLVQAHAQLGEALLSRSDGIPAAARRIVAEHHERVDGSGYPAGLTAPHISSLSQIVGIVDIYDTMLSNRGGRPPLPPTQALRQLYQLSTSGQYDREWVERIIGSLTVYPVGALVELNTGEWGIVLATTTGEALRPTVKLIRDPTQQPYTGSRIVDLSLSAPGTPKRVILRVLDPAREHLDPADYLTDAAG